MARSNFHQLWDVALQLAQGYNEGCFHAAYIYYVSSLFDILDVHIYLVLIAAILIHFALFPMSRIKEKG